MCQLCELVADELIRELYLKIFSTIGHVDRDHVREYLEEKEKSINEKLMTLKPLAAREGMNVNDSLDMGLDVVTKLMDAVKRSIDALDMDPSERISRNEIDKLERIMVENE